MFQIHDCSETHKPRIILRGGRGPDMKKILCQRTGIRVTRSNPEFLCAQGAFWTQPHFDEVATKNAWIFDRNMYRNYVFNAISRLEDICSNASGSRGSDVHKIPTQAALILKWSPLWDVERHSPLSVCQAKTSNSLVSEVPIHTIPYCTGQKHCLCTWKLSLVEDQL